MTCNTSITRLLLIAAVSLLAGSACQVEKDPERASKDSQRTQALEMPLNKVVIDNVSYWNGDRTDWKYFVIQEAGIVNIVVNFDNESAVPFVEVTNQVGQILSDLEDPESTEFLRRLSFKAAPQVYYLHIAAEEGETDYSVEVTFKTLDF